MDKNLVDKIVNTSFFNVDDLAELFKENGVSQIKTLANGTILCGSAEKCEMLIVFRFKPFGIMAEQSGKDVTGILLGGIEKEAAADSILYKNSDLCAVLRKKDDKLIVSTNDETELNPGEILEPAHSAIIKGNRIYTSDVSAMMLYLAIKCAESGRTAVALVNESSAGEGALSEIVRGIMPRMAVVVSAAAENEDFKIEKGVGIVIKDGCCVVHEKTVEKLNEAGSGDTQYYIGKTDTGLERLSISAVMEKFCGIYVAAAGIGTRVCELSVKDVEKTQNFLLKISDIFDII